MAVEPTQLVLVGILAVGAAFLLYGAIALGMFLWLRRRSSGVAGRLETGAVAVDGVAGIADGYDPVYSPVTGAGSLVYEYVLQHHVGSPATPDWRTVASGQAGVPFDLQTAAGRARVEPGAASLELPVAEELRFEADRGEADREDPPYGAIRLAGDGETMVFGDAVLSPGDEYRVVERRLEPGDDVHVGGVATRASRAPSDSSTRPAGATASDDDHLVFREDRGSLRQFLGVPFVIGDADGGVETQLRNRALVGLIFGLPLLMLAIVYLVPPGV